MSRPLIRTSSPGIYRRGKGYVVVLRDDSGRQFKRFADTLAEARRLRAGLQADIDRGEIGETRRITFSEYLEEWSGTYRGRSSRGLRQSTTCAPWNGTHCRCSAACSSPTSAWRT